MPISDGYSLLITDFWIAELMVNQAEEITVKAVIRCEFRMEGGG
jgi:hypothetical protein